MAIPEADVVVGLGGGAMPYVEVQRAVRRIAKASFDALALLEL